LKSIVNIGEKGETVSMAHCKKYNKAACGHMFKHYERAKDKDGQYIKFGNQNIDTSKTYLNYNLATDDQPDRQGDFVRKRCSEVKIQNRADVNVMCSWVITATKEIKAEETERFLRESYKFLSEKYGKENVVSAYVHMDEVTPHIHFAFVPVVRDKKKNILKVSAKELIDKYQLSIFHAKLSEHMENAFGRDVGILNEATKEGNQSIEELKRGTAQKELREQKELAKSFGQMVEGFKEEAEVETEKITALREKRESIESDMALTEKIYKGRKATLKEIELINPVQGAFGMKHITLEDVETLKRTAVGTVKKEIALEEATHEIERLKKENAELKKKTTVTQDAESLKRADVGTAMKGTSAYYKQEIEKLQKENSGQKKQSPTIAQEIERNRELTNLKNENQKLGNDYNSLAENYNKLIRAINQLPIEIREFVKNIITPAAPEQNERRRSRSDPDR